MWRWNIWVTVLLASAAWQCGHHDTPPVNPPAPVQVQAVTISEESVPVFTTVVANLEPMSRVMPGTRLMGRVSDVLVREGDIVQKGQVLANIESADLDARRGQAIGNIGQATARLENAETQLQRMEQLLQQRAATQQQYDNAKAERDAARAGLDAAQGMLREVEANMHYSEVTTPVMGVVAQTMVEPGDMAAPGQGMFIIEETRQMKVTAEVNEQDIAQVRKRMRLEVAITALSDTVVYGTVNAILPSGNAAARTFEVQLLVDNPRGGIRSGMFARVRFQRGQRRSLTVPEEAVTRQGQLEGVYVISDGQARLRWLRLGKRYAGRWEVVSGLLTGEQIVVNPMQTLRDGSPVEVAND